MCEGPEDLQHCVDRAIAAGLAPPEANEVSEKLANAISLDSANDQLKLLDYRWQTYLDKQYVESHQLDKFLEGLVQHLLKKKPDRPLEELILFLESARK